MIRMNGNASYNQTNRKESGSNQKYRLVNNKNRAIAITASAREGGRIILIRYKKAEETASSPSAHSQAYGTRWLRNNHQMHINARLANSTLAHFAPRIKSPVVKGIRPTWKRK